MKKITALLIFLFILLATIALKAQTAEEYFKQGKLKDDSAFYN